MAKITITPKATTTTDAPKSVHVSHSPRRQLQLQPAGRPANELASLRPEVTPADGSRCVPDLPDLPGSRSGRTSGLLLGAR